MNRKRLSFLLAGVVVLCEWMTAPAQAQVGHAQGMGIPDNGSVVGDTSALAREAQDIVDGGWMPIEVDHKDGLG